MDNPNCSTEHVKGQHLTYENRVEIQLRLKDGWTNAQIAKEIGCAYNTIKNEIVRGTVSLYNGQVKRYKADVGQAAYEENRLNSRKHINVLRCRNSLILSLRSFSARKNVAGCLRRLCSSRRNVHP
jgi:IS30 family transposase